MFTQPAISQQFLAFIAIAYVAFCFFYGRASLQARRNSAISRHLPKAGGEGGYIGAVANAGHLLRVAALLLAPVVVLATLLGFLGRERAGVIETSSLFTVSAHPEAILSFLADGPTVVKGQTVALFTSDTLGHQIAGLQAKRQELIASRDALQSSVPSQTSEDIAQQQGINQRLALIEQKLGDLERSQFSISQQLVMTRTSWQRARGDLAARMPELQEALASSISIHNVAVRALDRFQTLRGRGFATAPQVDQAEITEANARQRLNTTRGTLASTEKALATLDEGYEQSRALLEGQLAQTNAEQRTAQEQRNTVQKYGQTLHAKITTNEVSIRASRQYEIKAATARIEALDAEIAATVAHTHIKSPVDGRILYRNAASSTLTGALPILVVAPGDGFLMRVELPRDEVAALQRDVSAGRAIDIMVEDLNARRLVPARLVRIDANGIDPKRVTTVFGLEMPEDMLVRMALHGTSPRGTLRWAPPPHAMMLERIMTGLGLHREPVVSTETSRAATRPIANFPSERLGAPTHL